MERIRLDLKQFFNTNKHAKDEFIKRIESVYPKERKIIGRLQESTEKLLDWLTEHHQCIPMLIQILKNKDQMKLLKRIQSKATEYDKSGFKRTTSAGIFLRALMKECENIEEESKHKGISDQEENIDKQLFLQPEESRNQNKKELGIISEKKDCVNVEEESKHTRSDALQKKTEETLLQETKELLHQKKKEETIISEKVEYTCEKSRTNINVAVGGSDETASGKRPQIDQLRSRLSKLNEKLPTLKHEVSTLKEQIRTKEDQIQKLIAAIQMLNEHGNNLSEIIIGKEREIRDLQMEKNELQEKLQETERNTEKDRSSNICPIQ